MPIACKSIRGAVFRRSCAFGARRCGTLLLGVTTRILLPLLIIAVLTKSVAGQECEIYTRVYQESPEPDATHGKHSSGSIVVRNLSIFQRGNVYDKAEDSSDQVTIYESAARRFVILNTARKVMTELTFDQLESLMKDVAAQSEKSLTTLRDKPDPKTAKMVSLIQFQLRPDFRNAFDPVQKRLTLNSEHFTYEVQCAKIQPPELITAYLKYADWSAQLNYLLNPQAFLPGPRMALNAALREQQLMPIEITLKTDVGRGMRLRAEHRIDQQLEPGQLNKIYEWKKLLDSKDVKRVPFREFQESIAEKAKRPRS